MYDAWYNTHKVIDFIQNILNPIFFMYFRVGSNELMGGCTVGPSSVGIGRDHWFEMLENSRKPVAQWYTLQENIPGGLHDHTPNGRHSKQDNKVK